MVGLVPLPSKRRRDRSSPDAQFQNVHSFFQCHGFQYHGPSNQREALSARVLPKTTRLQVSQGWCRAVLVDLWSICRLPALYRRRSQLLGKAIAACFMNSTDDTESGILPKSKPYAMPSAKYFRPPADCVRVLSAAVPPSVSKAAHEHGGSESPDFAQRGFSFNLEECMGG